MAGLADTVAGALGVKPAASAPGYTGRVPDSEPRAILAEEARKFPDNPDIRREIELRFPDMAASSSSTAPQSFAAGPVIEALNAPQAAAPKAAPGPMETTLGRAIAVPQVVANQVTGVGAGIAGGYEGAWKAIKTIANGGTLADAAAAGAAEVRDRAVRGTYVPPEGSAGAEAVKATQSNYNPLNWPGMAANKAGEVVNDATGSPAAGAAVETLGNVVIPGAVARGLKLVPRGRAAPPVIDAEVVPPKETSLAAIAQGEDRRLPPVTPQRAAVLAEPVKAAAAPGPTAEQAAAARTPRPGETPPETAARAAEELAPKFSEAEPRAPVGQALGSDEQRRRSEVLARVGIAPEEQRVSAVRGDGTGASTDFQQSRVDNEAGRLIKTKLEAEREALANHSEGLVRQTGGSLGTDGQSLETRGHVILAPLDSLKTWFDKNTRALYKAADERAQGTPITLGNFKTVLDDASELTNSDRVHLQTGISAYLKKLGMAGEDGAVAGSAQQAETIRKYLNEQWSPQNSKLVGKLKDAIDEDVTRAAGDDIYQQARQMRTMRGATLDNPDGIAKIMDASGPEGINRKVPVERVADAITAMPNAQFAHIVETLKNVPPELRPQAGEALAEIKAQFANRLRDAGMGRAQGAQWNARDVSTYLNKNSAKLSQVFSTEELAGFRDLNDAGHILSHDRSYPGAAVQADNLLRRGALAVLPKFGAAVGGAAGAIVGAPGTGALVGQTVAAKAASTMAEKSALKNAQSRFGVRLSDFPK